MDLFPQGISFVSSSLALLSSPRHTHDALKIEVTRRLITSIGADGQQAENDEQLFLARGG